MALNKVAKRRILKLVEFMESLPRSAAKHFDMGAWFKHDGNHELPIESGEAIDKTVLQDCGTAACALGWAATMPYFRKLGLEVRYKYGSVGEVFVNGQQLDTLRPRGVLGRDIFSFEADENNYDRLFDLFAAGNEDKTPKAWAKRVRKLVKEWDAA